MPQEEVQYTIPDSGTTGVADGRTVDLILTYDPTANADGSYNVTAASGSYQTFGPGAVGDNDTITALIPAGNAASYGNCDDKLFLTSDPATMPIVDDGGISFTINNDTDSNDGKGSVNLFHNDGGYREDASGGRTTTTLTETAACFASGTLIRVARGDIAVEALKVGDVAITTSDERCPIRWLGHRKVDCRRHPDPRLVCPVCIAAHAFGENLPSRDLLVSPGHAVCVDMLGEVLIPASCLINGTTVRQVEVDHVTYWHVELDDHNILLAENLPAESYLEMGNRNFFLENDVTTLAGRPDAKIDTGTRTHADFCRPFHDQGPVVEAVRSRLRSRSLEVGWTVDSNGACADAHPVPRKAASTKMSSDC